MIGAARTRASHIAMDRRRHRGLGKADNSADQAPKGGAVQEFVTQYPPIQDHDAVGLVHGITADSTALTQGTIAPATRAVPGSMQVQLQI